jgi:signal transduction histidine kinase
MQGMDKMIDRQPGDRKRIETVVETLATLRGRSESLAEVAHDVRNMVTALGLYCDLLEEPGVLAAPYAHYGNELRLVASASRGLVEKLVALDAQSSSKAAAQAGGELKAEAVQESSWNMQPAPDAGHGAEGQRRWDLMPAMPIVNLAAELLANRNLLAALAGPAIGVTIDTDGGARPVRMTGEDLTRILVNLVKNAAEAMPAGGRISITLHERPANGETAASVQMMVEDSGPGFAAGDTERLFTSGYTTRGKEQQANGEWPFSHRGLGLAITRSIVEAAGGSVLAANRESGGARFTIELPVSEVGKLSAA